MSDQNPINELITLEKENQELLKELLKVTKSQRNYGRWKLGLDSLKLIVWPVVLILSIYFSIQAIQEFTQNLTQSVNPINILESFKGNSPAAAPSENTLEDILKLLGR